MFWELYPSATGEWWEDCGRHQEKEVKAREELTKKLDELNTELNKRTPIDLKSRRREFKFRTWSIKERHWVTEYSSIHNDCISINDPFKKADLLFQQFTGKKDSKGKDIYEGDIVRVNGELREIIWRDCMFTTKWAEYSLNACWFVGGGPEVVGNICENPELAAKLK